VQSNGTVLHLCEIDPISKPVFVCFLRFIFINIFLQDICSEIAFTVCYPENIILQKENTQIYNLVETPHKDDVFFLTS